MEQLRRLQRVTDAALGHLSPDDLLDELLERVREALSADTAAVLLLEPSGKMLLARAAKGLEEEVDQQIRIPFGRGFAGRIAAERRPVKIAEVDHTNVMNPILREKGVRSLLGVPLAVQGEVLGVLHVGTLKPRDFGDDDVELLQLVGDRLALALKVRLQERERLVADTLQRSLLPEALPSVPGLTLASRYLPAASGMVGGDWYDAFLIPGGQLAIAIGDVAGRGLGAASVMGRVRNALRAYAFEGHPPVEVAHRLDGLVSYFDSGALVTLLYGVIDPKLSTLRFALAGHMPPLMLTGDGAKFVESADRSDPPLGAFDTSSFRERTVSLDPGASLLLYTDGLVERREESLAAGLERLRTAAKRSRGRSASETLARILKEVLVAGRPADDVAVLIMQRSCNPA
jgi:hypothetical protein